MYQTPITLALALVLVSAATSQAPFPERAVHRITTRQFSPVAVLADDCDRIRMTTRPNHLGRGMIFLHLETAPDRSGHGMWWKRLEFYNPRGNKFEISAEGNGGRSGNRVLQVPVDEIARGQLVFVKPKFLGWPTAVYQIDGLSSLDGQDVTFRWEQDRC